MGDGLLVIKAFVILWFISVVVDCEIRKRAVHRIVLQESGRRPRSQYRHNSGRHNHFTHHHHGSKSNFKNGKHHHSLENDHSFEDGDSFSNENSFEDAFLKNKAQSSYNKPKAAYIQSFEDLGSDSFKVENPFSDALKGNAFNENWNIGKQKQFYQEPSRSKLKKPRKEVRKYKSPLEIEFTTAFPEKSPIAYYDATLYPPYYNTFNQQNLDTKQPQYMINYQDLLNLEAKTKSFNPIKGTKYEVREPLNENALANDQISFHALAPSNDATAESLINEQNRTDGIHTSGPSNLPTKTTRSRLNRGKNRY